MRAGDRAADAPPHSSVDDVMAETMPAQSENLADALHRIERQLAEAHARIALLEETIDTLRPPAIAGRVSSWRRRRIATRYGWS